MIALAVVLAIAGLIVWNKETERLDQDGLVNDFAEAIAADDGRSLELDGPERNVLLPGVMWGIGALLFLGGVILVATAPARPDNTQDA